MTHYYLSTACQHDLCARCRITCKFCGSECLCMCHHQKEPTVSNPENLDNPAAPDADRDAPTPTEGDDSLDESEVSPEGGTSEPVEDDDPDDAAEVGNDEDGEIGNLDELPEVDDTHDENESADTGADDDDPGVAVDDDPFGAGKDA